ARTSSGSSLRKSLCTTMPLLSAVTPQSAYMKARVFLLPRISTVGAWPCTKPAIAGTWPLISAGGVPAGSMLTTRILPASRPQPLTKAGHCWNWADIDVEACLFVEALLLRHHESGVRPLIDPVQPHGDVAQLGLRDRRAGERSGRERRAGATEELAAGG